MSNHKLKNYLRTYRRRTGLSQDELAYLLGSADRSFAARHEAFMRTPSLQTALAYEAIYRTPVKELFAGMYAKAESTTRRRAQTLKRRLATSGQCSPAKTQLLNRLAPDSRTQSKLVA